MGTPSLAARRVLPCAARREDWQLETRGALRKRLAWSLAVKSNLLCKFGTSVGSFSAPLVSIARAAGGHQFTLLYNVNQRKEDFNQSSRRAAREGGVAFRSVLRYQLPDPDRVPLAPSYHQILSLGGFEPPTFTLSVYCSTTEL